MHRNTTIIFHRLVRSSCLHEWFTNYSMNVFFPRNTNKRCKENIFLTLLAAIKFYRRQTIRNWKYTSYMLMLNMSHTYLALKVIPTLRCDFHVVETSWIEMETEYSTERRESEARGWGYSWWGGSDSWWYCLSLQQVCSAWEEIFQTSSMTKNCVYNSSDA